MSITPEPRHVSSLQVGDLLTDDARLVAWIERHHAVAASSRARVEQAEAGVAVARLVPNPMLTAAFGGMAVGERNPPQLAWADSLNWSIGVSQTLEIAKRGPRAQAATQRRTVAQLDYRSVVANWAADVRQAIGHLIFLKSRIAILEERLESARRTLELEKVRLEHGDISGTDYNRLALDMAASESEIAEASAEFTRSLQDCHFALSTACRLDYGDDALLESAAITPPNESATVCGKTSRSDIAALLERAASSDSEALLARRQRIPDLNVGLSYTRDRLTYAGNQPHTLGVSLTAPIPLFDLGEARARVALKDADALRAQAQILVSQACHDAIALQARHDILEEKLKRVQNAVLPRAQEVLGATEVAFRRGGASMTDFLLARREHSAIRLDIAQTRYELFSIRNELRRALGVDAKYATLVR